MGSDLSKTNDSERSEVPSSWLMAQLEPTMNFLKAEAFFNLSRGPMRELFAQTDHVWDTLAFLPAYIENMMRPEVLGEVEEGAWLEPGRVQLGEGSRVEREAVIRGPTIIGRNTLIRSGAYLRGHVMIGDECIIEHGTEILRSVVLDQARMPHSNCLMVSLVGNRVTLGAFAATSSILPGVKEIEIKIDSAKNRQSIPTGLDRFGAVVGDDSNMGGHVFLLPGTVIGRGCQIEPQIYLSGYIKSGSWARPTGARFEIVPRQGGGSAHIDEPPENP